MINGGATHSSPSAVRRGVKVARLPRPTLDLMLHITQSRPAHPPPVPELADRDEGSRRPHHSTQVNEHDHLAPKPHSFGLEFALGGAATK